VSQSRWAFALIETVHLLALSCLGGALIVMHLRWLNVLLTSIPAGRLARALRPWIWTNLALMVLSGLSMVAGDPMHYFYNPAFRLKMALLAAAATGLLLLLHLAAQAKQSPITPWLAALSLLLWLGVALSGRAIGLL
jgi:hypothetical protein